MERSSSERRDPPGAPDERHDPHVEGLAEDRHDEDTPYGAIIVTTVVAIAILVSWYGIYALNLVRS